jgi:NAD(P)-dependent dehydrogenase (short-subunit alcohol dehydrogenase family)
VVVTGGASGLGAAYARRFARAGAKLALLDLDLAQRRLAAELEARRQRGVWRSPATCGTERLRGRRRRAGALRRRRRVVNNAGITHRSAFAVTEAVFRRVMDVNFFGSLHCTKAALPALLARRGLVIAVSSIAGVAPLYGRTGYAASKHAVQGFFASLRGELAPLGVDVLIVCPGFTATGIATAALDGDGSVTAHPQSTVGALATPESVAEAVVRAASAGRSLLVLSAAGKAASAQPFWPALYDRLMAASPERARALRVPR